MRDDIYNNLTNNIDLAIANGYTMNGFFSLTEKNGSYMPSDDHQLSCHPLETVVLGQKITRPINVEIAVNLGVHPSWVDGFLDGYGGSGYNESYFRLHRNDPLRKCYTEGFEDGHEVEDWIIELDW